MRSISYNFTEVQVSRVIIVLLLQNCFVWCKDHTHQAILTIELLETSMLTRQLNWGKKNLIGNSEGVFSFWIVIKQVHSDNMVIFVLEKTTSFKHNSLQNDIKIYFFKKINNIFDFRVVKYWKINITSVCCNQRKQDTARQHEKCSPLERRPFDSKTATQTRTRLSQL